MKSQTITLTITGGNYIGKNPNGFLCAHEDTYDGAPDSNHPLGSGDSAVDSLADWVEQADHINDGDITDYMDAEPSDSVVLQFSMTPEWVRDIAKAASALRFSSDSCVTPAAQNELLRIAATLTDIENEYLRVTEQAQGVYASE